MKVTGVLAQATFRLCRSSSQLLIEIRSQLPVILSASGLKIRAVVLVSNVPYSRKVDDQGVATLEYYSFESGELGSKNTL